MFGLCSPGRCVRLAGLRVAYVCNDGWDLGLRLLFPELPPGALGGWQWRLKVIDRFRPYDQVLKELAPGGPGLGSHVRNSFIHVDVQEDAPVQKLARAHLGACGRGRQVFIRFVVEEDELLYEPASARIGQWPTWSLVWPCRLGPVDIQANNNNTVSSALSAVVHANQCIMAPLRFGTAVLFTHQHTSEPPGRGSALPLQNFREELRGRPAWKDRAPGDRATPEPGGSPQPRSRHDRPAGRGSAKPVNDRIIRGQGDAGAGSGRTAPQHGDGPATADSRRIREKTSPGERGKEQPEHGQRPEGAETAGKC